MRVRIFAFNAPRQRKQDRLSSLQFVSALLQFQKRLNAGQKFSPIHRATQEIICTNLNTFQSILFVRKRRDQDHRYQTRFRAGLDCLACLKPIQARHHHIQKHQVDLGAGEFFHRSCTVRHSNHFASLCCEEFL